MTTKNKLSRKYLPLPWLVWAGQFLRGRSILVIALVMGIAATGFRFMVPQQWSWDMRIGPDYIGTRSEHALRQPPQEPGS